MSTHNICFRGEIRDISFFRMKKSALSVAMISFFGRQPPPFVLDADRATQERGFILNAVLIYAPVVMCPSHS